MENTQRKQTQEMFDEFMDRIEREGLKLCKIEFSAKGFYPIKDSIVKRGKMKESFSVK